MNKEEIIYPSMVIRSQAEAIELLQQENQQLKEVIKEVREYIKEHLTDNGRFLMLNEWQVPDLLQILDKGESNE